MMAYLGYDAIAVGETDLNYGLQKLKDDAEQYGLPLTCANLVPRGGDGSKTVFPPHLVVERDGVRFGFVGLLSPQTKVRTLHRDDNSEVKRELSAMTYTITDPLEAARSAVPRAAAECDVLVLLAHMDMRELEALLPELTDVDFVILGHNPKTTPVTQPVDVDGVMVYRATPQGQHLGHLTLTVGEDGTLLDRSHRNYFLDGNVPDDEDMVALLEEFEQENRETQKLLFARQQLEAGGGSGGPTRYLGVGACQACHAEEFDVYIETRHAHAYETLASQFVHRDSNCIGCHSTGYGEPGGYSGFRYRGLEVDLVDVQCEACHGPGSDHSRDGSYLETAIESCTKCHTPEDDPDFDFDTDWPKVAH